MRVGKHQELWSQQWRCGGVGGGKHQHGHRQVWQGRVAGYEGEWLIMPQNQKVSHTVGRQVFKGAHGGGQARPRGQSVDV